LSCAKNSPSKTKNSSKNSGEPSGLSVDWTLTYRTIDDHSQRVAQQAFLNNLARGEAYQADAPPCGTSPSALLLPRPSWKTVTNPPPTTK
jgi:hypothetical protein